MSDFTRFSALRSFLSGHDLEYEEQKLRKQYLKNAKNLIFKMF